MRVSSYVIHAPMPESDESLLIHGYSGAIDLVPRSVSEALQRAAQREQTDGLDLPDHMLTTLRTRGYLTEMTPSEEQEYCLTLATILHEQSKQNGNFWFIPTYGCNLRCPYCFERGLRKEAWFEQTMTCEMVDRAYAVIDALDGAKKVKGPLGLFGGEPFLEANRDLIYYIVEQGVQRGYTFVAVSNAVQLEPFLPLLGPGKVELIQVTVDGPPDLNDLSRIQADRSGTFDLIAHNVSLALNTGVTISMRSNVNRRSIDRMQELALIYQRLGWTAYPNFSAYSAPITEVDFLIARREKAQMQGQPQPPGSAAMPAKKSAPAALKVLRADAGASCGSCESSATHVQFPAAVDRTASIQQRRLVTRVEMVEHLLEDKPTEQIIRAGVEAKNAFKRLATTGTYKGYAVDFCSAYTGMLLFDPFGEMYACWDLVGKPEHAVGRYAPTLVFDEQRLNLWRGHTVAAIPQCRECKFALLHGGGCAYLALGEAGTLLSPHCEGFPELFIKLAPIAYKELEAAKSSAVEQQAMQRSLMPSQ
jgi:uncharacterized protein